MIAWAPGKAVISGAYSVLEGAPAYTWFAMRRDPDFRAELQHITSEFHAEAAPAAAEAAPPKRARRPKRYAVRYTLIFECARELWARDTEHAEQVLAEDTAVLLEPDCLDRWLDDQTGFGWRLEEVALAEDAA